MSAACRSVALAALLLAAPVSVAAQSADALLDEGVALREQGRDAEALERFERAYGMTRSPRALAQVALAEQALARWVAAEQHLAAALARPDAWVTERRALLERGLARIREELGRVELLGGPPGADVSVDGRAIGRLPLPGPVSVEVGQRTVDVRADGQGSFQQRVVVVAGRTTRVQVQMQAGAPGVAPRQASASRDDNLLIGMGVGYGVGGVGLLLFATLGGIAIGEYEAVESGCGRTNSCTESDVGGVRDLTGGADAMLTIGLLGVAAGTALLLWWLLSPADGERAARRLFDGGAAPRIVGSF